MIYITGDIHGYPNRLSNKYFPEQKDFEGGKENNFVIICGDFGLVWDQYKESVNESYWLDWLEDRNFTTLFVSGNHENFDRLYSDEYPIDNWNGGRVQKIRPHVIHLLRGEYYTIDGKTFFTFGGALSRDIQGGVLDATDPLFLEKKRQLDREHINYRINHVSWWKEEVASKKEMQYGRENLAKHNNEVDFVITHCAPQNIASFMGFYDPEPMTMYFDELAASIRFSHWYFGHYHTEARIFGKFDALYSSIIRIA